MNTCPSISLHGSRYALFEMTSSAPQPGDNVNQVEGVWGNTPDINRCCNNHCEARRNFGSAPMPTKTCTLELKKSFCNSRPYCKSTLSRVPNSTWGQKRPQWANRGRTGVGAKHRRGLKSSGHGKDDQYGLLVAQAEPLQGWAPQLLNYVC